VARLSPLGVEDAWQRDKLKKRASNVVKEDVVRAIAYGAAVGVALLVHLTNGIDVSARQPQNPSSAAGSVATGADIYRTYCASCHGVGARGDGPLAESLRRRPANLTEIAKRNKGIYPQDLVYRIIDGRQKVAGHGGPDMPVWGDAFMRTQGTPDEASVRVRIQGLVDYLETIQARDGQ
jgi:mono/diheme cytochrome c family protein